MVGWKEGVRYDDRAGQWPRTDAPGHHWGKHAVRCATPFSSDSGGAAPVIRHGHSAYQAISNLLCERLHRALSDGMQRAPGAAEGTDSVPFRVSGALYALLMAHPIDQHGRCRSCRRLGGVLGLRRGRCGVHREASYWLRQPEEFLRSRLADEWGLADLPPAAARDLTHGGAGDVPDGLRSRRVPPDNSSSAGISLLLTGGMA